MDEGWKFPHRHRLWCLWNESEPFVKNTIIFATSKIDRWPHHLLTIGVMSAFDQARSLDGKIGSQEKVAHNTWQMFSLIPSGTGKWLPRSCRCLEVDLYLPCIWIPFFFVAFTLSLPVNLDFAFCDPVVKGSIGNQLNLLQNSLIRHSDRIHRKAVQCLNARIRFKNKNHPFPPQWQEIHHGPAWYVSPPYFPFPSFASQYPPLLLHIFPDRN